MTLLAAAVTADFHGAVDETIFRAINGLKLPVLDALFVLASSPYFGIAGVTIIALWCIWHFKKRFVYGLVPLAVAITVTDAVGHRFIKPFFGRMRPCFALPADHVRRLVEVSNVGSLPSLHAANAFAAATVITLLVPRSAWVAMPVAALVALSRVGVGVHWPSDILAGAVFGALVAVGTMELTQRLFGHFGVKAALDLK